jgi:hypothetical protein
MSQTRNIELLGVKVQETPNTFAEYIAEVRSHSVSAVSVVDAAAGAPILYGTKEEAWVRSN